MYFSWEIMIFGCFIVDATLAIDFILRFLAEKKPETRMNKLVCTVMVASAIWSIGMGIMSIQTDDKWAYVWRIIGIFGTFMFMMSVQKTMCLVSDIPAKMQVVLNGISYLGVIVFIMYIQPKQTIFVHNAIGTTFYFKQNLTNVIYSLYFTVVCINIFVVTLHMTFKHKLQRVRVTGKRFIIVELLIFVGAIFDMVIPSIGKPALPGSAITHFWGVFVFWYAVHDIYRASITIGNMSEYIYFSLDIPVLVFDSTKKLCIMNDASSSFFQINHAWIVQQEFRIEKLCHSDESIFNFTGKSSIVETTTKNGVKCQLAISEIDDVYGDIVGYILIVNDLSEHYLVINKLEEAKRAADAANLSKSLFLANMSHEIRTPMNAILGFSDLALKNNLQEEANKYFRDIKRSGETLLTLINQILNISKIELGKAELIDGNYKPADVFHEVSVIVGIEAQKKNLQYEMYIDENYPEELYGDKDKIREVLINLLNNSVKYTKSGTIKLEANVLESREKEVTVEYKVTDTGIGIKKEDIHSVFEKFKRMDLKANSQTEGTGLGLSITKGIVELMGGTISVESEYGVGSVFTVILTQRVVDASPIQLEETIQEESDKKEIRFKDIKILEVDDNEINLMVVSGILDYYEIPYDLAASGQEAVELCRTNQYDVIFMDQMMPVMDGVEAMQLIRKLPNYERRGERKIIALTANVIEGVKEELLTEGFDAFLGKPIDIEEFESTLKKLLPKDKYYYL